MSKPAFSPDAVFTKGELQADASGHLYDMATRQAALDMGGAACADVLEALGALRLAAKQLHDSMQHFADGHGLSDSRLRVLTRLHHSPEHRLPLGALADALSVTPRTMTDIIDVLERDGLVKRFADANDRRSVLAALTKQGLQRINVVRRSAITRQTAIAEGFTSEQLVQLRHLCLLLVRNLARDHGGK
jgi:DNA-binding MarR family transcriptional regulator